MDYDIFFSYPHKDAQEVQQILQALQAEGLNVWIDKSEISDYASITNSIVEGLAHSKVLLAYYSLNYWRSRACQWELTAGFLAAQREGDPRKRVLVINPDEKAEHIHPVELRDELFQKAPKDAEALKKLVQSMKNHVSGIKNAIGEIHTLTQPSWYPNAGASSNRFVGRLPDMWHIHSALNASGVPIITGAVASAIVQLQGMGGVGKSLLAEEYALRYAAAYPGGVFWLRAFGNDDAKTSMGEEREAERIRQILDFAIKCGIPVEKKSPPEIEAALARELGARGKPYLWVVDDVPSGMEMETLKKWLSPHPLGRTLITTRTKEYNSLGKLIPLGVLEPEEAYELLTLRRKPSGKEEETAARMLIDDLGYHALAVDVAGALLDAKKGLQTFAEFRKKLFQTEKDELEYASKLKEILPTGHEKSIASTLLRSIKQLEPEGLDFLRLASVLAVAPIPASLVSAVFSKLDDQDDDSGDMNAMLAFDQVENLSLAESDKESGAKTVHTLISRTVRFRETTPERIDQIQVAAFRALIDILSVIGDGRIHNELKLEVAHARQLLNRGNDIQIVNLTGWVASFDKLHGDYKSAETLLRREYGIRNRLQGTEHRDTLSIMNNIAETRRYQGDFEGARKIQEPVLEIMQRTLGKEDHDTLTAMNNLALTQYAQGDFEGARKIQESVLEIMQRTLEKENPDTLKSMNNLALTLGAQGDLTGARKIHEQVLEITQLTLSNEHPDTLITMNNLASTQYAQGDLTGARKIQEQVLEILQRTLEKEKPDTLTTMNNLAETQRAQGDHTGARKIHEQVLEIRQRKMGKEHPDTLQSMNNLALTLGAQYDLEGARKIHEQVLEIRQRTLGKEHPDTLITMSNLAESMRYQGDLEGTRKIQEQVLEISHRTLGKEHPDTSISAWNLLFTLVGLGENAQANDLMEKHLIWLLDRDVATLGANLQQIRGLIIQRRGGSAGAGGAPLN